MRELDETFRDDNARLSGENYQLRLDIKELTDILNDVANKM